MCSWTIGNSTDKKVRIVMTNERRTTQKCPTGRRSDHRSRSSKTTRRKGECTKDGPRVNVHGTSFCCLRKRQRSCDYVASLTIARNFFGYFYYGQALDYLSN